jgi:hypothetical protein
MRPFRESTLAELFGSTVLAFPNTRMRQHATEPLVIEELNYVPFLGVKTLFIRAGVRNEDRHYKPIVLIKGIDYKAKGTKITDENGKVYEFGPLSINENEVNVRCQCADFTWRFNYYDYEDSSLYGNKRRKYESSGGPSANPLELPGMCKHLIKVMEALRQYGIFTS